MESPARIHCIACAWMVYDPNFRKEEARYFPSDRTDRRIEWRNENRGYDLYEPRSVACQLRITVGTLRKSVIDDPAAPVILGRGLIACNTPALQSWWDGKNHHR
jgi:hypothetical protein